MLGTDPAKISCVANWPIPRNKADLQRFLGFASYYRRFVRSFAQLASPLHALTQKGTRFVRSFAQLASPLHALIDSERYTVGMD